MLQDLTYGFDVDIDCVTETWLNESISDFKQIDTKSCLYLVVYNRTGGGVLIAIKTSSKFNMFNNIHGKITQF